MMNVAELDGKRFTVWLTDEADESAIFSGIASWDGDVLSIQRGSQHDFRIQPEWHGRMRAVANDESRRILLEAEFYLRLWVGGLPDDSANYEATGLKWPG